MNPRCTLSTCPRRHRNASSTITSVYDYSEMCVHARITVLADSIFIVVYMPIMINTQPSSLTFVCNFLCATDSQSIRTLQKGEMNHDQSLPIP